MTRSGRCVLGLLALGLFLCGHVSHAQASENGVDSAQSLPEPTDPALRDRERQGLMVFYEALGGPDWISTRRSADRSGSSATSGAAAGRWESGTA
jgi:hypothetical protein